MREVVTELRFPFDEAVAEITGDGTVVAVYSSYEGDETAALVCRGCRVSGCSTEIDGVSCSGVDPELTYAVVLVQNERGRKLFELNGRCAIVISNGHEE